MLHSFITNDPLFHDEKWSAEEKHIAENRMGEFHNVRWNINTLCRVHWKWMGYKKNLQQSTQSYINHICQPTLQHICKDGAWSAIREDLWANATIEISPSEFSDKFDFSKCERALCS